MNSLLYTVLAANSSKEALEFLERFKEWIDHADVVMLIWRSVQWGFVKLLYMFSSMAEKSVDNILTLGGFLNYGPIATIYNSMKLIAFAIIIVMIALMGLKTMFNMGPKLKDTTIRLVILGCLMVELPALMTMGLDISKTFFQESKSAGATTVNNDSLSFSLIKENTADLAFVAMGDFAAFEEGTVIIDAPDQSGTIVPEKNMLTEDMFGVISMVDVITPTDAKKLSQASPRAEYLGYRMSFDFDGKQEAVKIENGFFDMFKEGVFRFPANFATINIGLITLGFAYVMALFVLTQNFIELAFKKILFPIVAASDIETGQRTKKFIEDISQSFLAIMLTGLSLRVFTIYYAYIGTLGLNWFLFAIASFVGAMVCMNGTNTIAKHFGVDVGVKDGLKGMLMMMAAGKLTKDAVTGAGKGAKNLADKGIKATEAGYETAKKSVNDAKTGVDKGAKKLGSEMAQFEERGLSGYATDKKEAMKQAATAKKEGAQEKALETVGKITQPAKDIKDNFQKGQEEGIVKGINKNGSENKAEINAEKESQSKSAREAEVANKGRLAVNNEADGEVNKTGIPSTPRINKEHLDPNAVKTAEGEEKTMSTSVPIPKNMGEKAPLTHSEQQAEKIKEAMNSGSLNKDVDRDNPTLSTSTKPNTEGTQAVPRSLDGIKTEGVAKVEGAVKAEGELKGQGTVEKSLTTNPTSVATPTKVDADIKTSVQGNGAAGAVNLNFAETKQQQFNSTSSNAATVNQTMNQNETKNVSENMQATTNVANNQTNQVTKNKSNQLNSNVAVHGSGTSNLKSKSSSVKGHGNFDVNFDNLFGEEPPEE